MRELSIKRFEIPPYAVLGVDFQFYNERQS